LGNHHPVAGRQMFTSMSEVSGSFAGSAKQTTAREAQRSSKDFLVALFRALDAHGICYCVLHSWEGLPDNLRSDLDLAVRRSDAEKLRFVFKSLQRKGYQPVAIFSYFVDAYCFRFAWFEGPLVRSAAVDIIFKHQRGVLTTPSAERIVGARRRHGEFWIPAPDSEFSYLLARRACKGTASIAQKRRLRLLIEQLGKTEAEKLASEMFLGQLNIRVVNACVDGELSPLLGQMGREAWKASVVRHPLSLLGNFIRNGLRRIRRWRQPSGLLVAVMGPDGVGKSTLINNLMPSVEGVFDRQRIFHWRPMLLWRRNNSQDVSQPHSVPADGWWRSAARVFAHILDYWLGYWLMIRPLLMRSGLVVFDRYFNDVLVDPKRYRYGGPLWLPRMLSYLVPQPDLTLLLDAPEDTVLSRKQEIDATEMRRQRALYLRYVGNRASARIIDATQSFSEVSTEANRAIIDRLQERLQEQNRRWLVPPGESRLRA
jgi:thymidylate kinase